MKLPKREKRCAGFEKEVRSKRKKERERESEREQGEVKRGDNEKPERRRVSYQVVKF